MFKGQAFNLPIFVFFSTNMDLSFSLTLFMRYGFSIYEGILFGIFLLYGLVIFIKSVRVLRYNFSLLLKGWVSWI